MRKSTELDPSALWRMLACWPVARLSITQPGHSPWSVPIVFAPALGKLWSPLDGKPKSGRPLARVGHLERERKATLLLDHYSPVWDTLWWVRLEAETNVCVLSDAEPHAHPGALALTRKYQQYGSTPLFAGQPTLLSLRPTGQSAWAAKGLDALEAQWSENSQ